jgi:hypothetical protein
MSTELIVPYVLAGVLFLLYMFRRRRRLDGQE